jgi:hypothetical protein
MNDVSFKNGPTSSLPFLQSRTGSGAILLQETSGVSCLLSTAWSKYRYATSQVVSSFMVALRSTNPFLVASSCPDAVIAVAVTVAAVAELAATTAFSSPSIRQAF